MFHITPPSITFSTLRHNKRRSHTTDPHLIPQSFPPLFPPFSLPALTTKFRIQIIDLYPKIMADTVPKYVGTKFDPFAISFLDYAREIRDHIYRSLLIDGPWSHLPPEDPEGYYVLWDHLVSKWHSNSMLLVNRQIRDEFLHTFCSGDPMPILTRVLRERPAKGGNVVRQKPLRPSEQTLLPYVRRLHFECHLTPALPTSKPDDFLFVKVIQDLIKATPNIRLGKSTIWLHVRSSFSIYRIACQVAPLLELQALSWLQFKTWSSPQSFAASWKFVRMKGSMQWVLMKIQGGSDYNVNHFEYLKIRDGKPIEFQDQVRDKSDEDSVKSWSLLRDNGMPLGYVECDFLEP